MMKKIRHYCSLLLTKLTVAILCAAFLLSGCIGSKDDVKVQQIKIAVLTYDEYDTLIDSITKEMTRWCRQKEKDTGISPVCQSWQ